MKFHVTVEGGHVADVTINPAGNTFTGQVISADYGTGDIVEGLQDQNGLRGKVSLDGYLADFTATLSDNAISGKLSYGWFFSKKFSGIRSDNEV